MAGYKESNDFVHFLLSNSFVDLDAKFIVSYDILKKNEDERETVNYQIIKFHGDKSQNLLS